jgi:hypothetical protein
MRPFHLQLCLVLILAASGPLLAQSQTYSNDAFRDLPPTSRRADGPPVPKMAFLLEAEIPLPGPLPGAGPRLRGELVEIPVAGGTVLTRPAPGAIPSLVASSDVGEAGPEATPWVEDQRGRLRYRAVPGGALEAQRRCKRCKAGWKGTWKLRVPGNTLAPPLIGERHIYFGALDNRVYCVKARNGHRVWVTDLGARVSSPLVSWRGSIGGSPLDDTTSPQEELSLILAVPDGGAELTAIDSQRGLPVASLRLEDDEGKLVSGPLATPDGRIVVARQKYAETEASLMVYRLREFVQPEPHSGEEPPLPPADGSNDTATPTESGADSTHDHQGLSRPDLGAVLATYLDDLCLVGHSGTPVNDLVERLHHLDEAYRLTRAHPAPDLDERWRLG